MASNYVAFGQLIEGEETLKKIENVETYYESPKSEIIISKSGIFNMECQDIMINKNAKEYVFLHTEDLIALGELLYEVRSCTHRWVAKYIDFNLLTCTLKSLKVIR